MGVAEALGPLDFGGGELLRVLDLGAQLLDRLDLGARAGQPGVGFGVGGLRQPHQRQLVGLGLGGFGLGLGQQLGGAAQLLIRTLANISVVRVMAFSFISNDSAFRSWTN